ncbi:MAG: hypothetical protein M9899_10800 [Bdellovibrionaceae bacterium]|nr:hypothetical protein [Pseudobdellovibrionaceae bacterium]
MTHILSAENLANFDGLRYVFSLCVIWGGDSGNVQENKWVNVQVTDGLAGEYPYVLDV